MVENERNAIVTVLLLQKENVAKERQGLQGRSTSGIEGMWERKQRQHEQQDGERNRSNISTQHEYILAVIMEHMGHALPYERRTYPWPFPRFHYLSEQI